MSLRDAKELFTKITVDGTGPDHKELGKGLTLLAEVLQEMSKDIEAIKVAVKAKRPDMM